MDLRYLLVVLFLHIVNSLARRRIRFMSEFINWKAGNSEVGVTQFYFNSNLPRADPPPC